ncbi:TPA: restriction endonuclease subunit S [Acinetobacter baumannii]|nr:restriction endonuclease subunit S [Acinetobacter baumannii]
MAVPKLRFKDFDEDWTLTTLNQLSTKIGDGIHATPKYDESGTIPFINGNNLVNGRIAINENTKRISSEEFQKYNQILSDRTLFLSINGTIGNLAFYKNEKVLLGKSVCFINLKNDLDKKFIYLLLQSPQLTKTLNSELTGTTIKNLSLATVRNSEFYCPIEAEQTKIASFLSAVDEKISQLTQKHQLLSQYKQGMMQKLFSQQIRFKADDGSEFGEWEEVALSKVSDVRDGTHDSPSYVKDGYPLITSKNLKNGKLDLTDINLISEDDYLNINKRSAVNIGDIIFGMIGTIGNPVLLNSDGFAIKNVALIKEKDELLNIYLIHYLNSSFFAKQVALLNAGNTQKFLALGQIRSLSIHKPQLAEQTKIANFLSSIDQKIEVVAQQIEQAKQWKKGLLQQMFV